MWYSGPLFQVCFNLHHIPTDRPVHIQRRPVGEVLHVSLVWRCAFVLAFCLRYLAACSCCSLVFFFFLFLNLFIPIFSLPDYTLLFFTLSDYIYLPIICCYVFFILDYTLFSSYLSIHCFSFLHSLFTPFYQLFISTFLRCVFFLLYMAGAT